MAKDQYRAEVIDPGDQASKLAARICRESFFNCGAVEVKDFQETRFRGPVTFSWKPHVLDGLKTGRLKVIVQNDGAGGKPQFFTLLGSKDAFAQLGWEIITMNADDIARFGGRPCVMANEIQVQGLNQNNLPLFRAMMEGYGQALSVAHLVNLTGEIAIMKNSITAFCADQPENQLILTWGGTCIGLVPRQRLLDGSKILPGMPIVGFREPGYRCNGGGFFTKLLLERFGPGIESIRTNETAQRLIKELTIPSTSYAKTVCRLLGWQPDGRLGKPQAKVLGIAHITGGGVWSKLGDLLPQGVGANLSNMPDPPDALIWGQNLSKATPHPISDWQCYSTFHGGCGMLLVCQTEADAQKVMAEAKKDKVGSQIVGFTTKSAQREIVITSQFKYSGRILSSLHPE